MGLWELLIYIPKQIFLCLSRSVMLRIIMKRDIKWINGLFVNFCYFARSFVCPVSNSVPSSLGGCRRRLRNLKLDFRNNFQENNHKFFMIHLDLSVKNIFHSVLSLFGCRTTSMTLYDSEIYGERQSSTWKLAKLQQRMAWKIYVQHLTPAMHACVAILRSLCFLFVTQPPGARIVSDTQKATQAMRRFEAGQP